MIRESHNRLNEVHELWSKSPQTVEQSSQSEQAKVHILRKESSQSVGLAFTICWTEGAHSMKQVQCVEQTFTICGTKTSPRPVHKTQFTICGKQIHNLWKQIHNLWKQADRSQSAKQAVSIRGNKTNCTIRGNIKLTSCGTKNSSRTVKQYIHNMRNKKVHNLRNETFYKLGKLSSQFATTNVHNSVAQTSSHGEAKTRFTIWDNKKVRKLGDKSSQFEGHRDHNLRHTKAHNLRTQKFKIWGNKQRTIWGTTKFALWKQKSHNLRNKEYHIVRKQRVHNLTNKKFTIWGTKQFTCWGN